MRPSARIASAVTSARAGGPRRSAAEHVVFGAGAVGLAIADALLARGVAPGQVRVVNHSGHASLPAGVQSLGGDASDPAFAVHAAAGARVVYQVLNAPYHRWARDFPPLQHGVIAAAAAAGARLVTLENLYAYGAPAARPDGATAPFTEDSPLTPHTRKGAVRAQMHAELMGAHAAGRVEVTVGRASDYFGPRGGGQAVNLGDQAMRAALAGRPAQVLGDPDQPHTYSYIPDIAAGLAILGEHPDAPARSGTCRTTRGLAPPGNCSTSLTSSPASLVPGCSGCLSSPCAVSACSGPGPGKQSKCCTSSTGPSSWTAPTSRRSAPSTRRLNRPSKPPSPPTADQAASMP
jgi:nucleoside-diphosphate-sugar epimerase